MHRRHVIWAAALLGLFCLPLTAQEAVKAQYIGVEACGKCHKRDSTGNQLAKWRETRHANAFATLASPKALEVAEERGIDDPQKDERCVRCHVTAYGVDPSLIAPVAEGKRGLVAEDGVQCESCHGPGSLYKKRKIMKSRETAVAAGLLIPDEKTCTACHNKDSPMYKEFDFEEMKKKIIHPNPKKAAEAVGD